MECTCAKTRPRFILSFERVSGGWGGEGGIESEPMLTSREKSPLLEENSPQKRIESTRLRQQGQRAQHTASELFRLCQANLEAGQKVPKYT